MTHTNQNKEKVFETLPPEWDQTLLPLIQEKIKGLHQKIVVLDDDPTGTQTVHGMPVLTTWSVPILKRELRKSGPGFFILTNSGVLTGKRPVFWGRKSA